MDTATKLNIEQLLNTAAEKKVSDLHLSVGSAPTLRLNDQLLPLTDAPTVTKEFMEAFVEIVLEPDQRKTLLERKEIVIAYQFHKQARFRINLYYQKGVLAAYLRFIGAMVIPLYRLGLPLTVQQLAERHSGLVIISGSFGSGKTTTSAAIVDHINRTRSSYVLTIEEPIEYLFGNQRSVVEQREIGRDAISFDQALSAVTQEDVDVVFIAKLPTAAVIRETLMIAASGRLVIANLEADTSVTSLDLLINSFPTNEQYQIREQLSVTLAGIVCQRLVPRVGGGFVPVAEIMTTTPAIKSIIKEGSLYQINNIIQTSREEGMVSLDWSLAELVKTNEITLEEALANAGDPQQLKYILHA